MRFLSPEWLILIPVLIFIGWKWKTLELHRPLRILLLIIFLLLLIQPEIRHLGKGMDLWVLVDRSASTEEMMSQNLDEMEGLLQRSKPSENNIFFVDYAESSVLRDEGTAGGSGSKNISDTAQAVRYALSQMDSARASRLLVLSDGYHSNSMTGLLERLIRQQVPLDYRLLNPPGIKDFAVQKLKIPSRAQPGEPFLVELRVSGSADGDVPVEILRDGEKRG
ncbi:MAG: hypothetical protein ACK5NG_00565, partial [Chthoniobacterales bacterium]